MTIFGRVSGHLVRARETALAHDCHSAAERVAVETVVAQIDVLLAAVRRVHHDTAIRRAAGDE